MMTPLGTREGTPAREDRRRMRLQTLQRRWDEFAVEYEQAQARNDQQHMTNVRGLMILIKQEMRRLGGEVRESPFRGQAHLGDL